MERINATMQDTCNECGTPLLIQARYQLTQPLRDLDSDSRYQVFAVNDRLAPNKQKVIKILVRPDAKAVELLKREAYVLKAITHPGIPEVDLDADFCIEINSTCSLHCLVLHRIEGENLLDWLNKHGRVSQELAIDWLGQLGRILHEVHKQGYFHRDLKPENLLLQPNGKLALLDFGAVREVSETYLAKLGIPDGKVARTTNGEITSIFTIGYGAPEQYNGRALPQSDFFCLGRTMAHLVTATHPSEMNDLNKIGQIIWRDKAPQISSVYKDFIDKLMNPIPRKRPHDSAALLQELGHTLPKRLKRYQILHSRVVRFTAIALGSALLITLAWVARNYWFDRTVSAALVEEKRGDLVEAREKYEQAININPSNFLTYNYLATLCVQLKDLDCAIANYQRAIPYIPDDEKWVAYYNLGRVHDDLESYSAAREHYEKAIQLSEGKQIYPINNLVRLDLLAGKASGAKDRLLPLLNLTDNNDTQGAIYKNLGWTEFVLGQYVEAQQYLNNAITKSPTRAGAFCLMAKTQEKLKQFDSSIVQNCLLLDTELTEVFSWKSEVLKRVSENPQ